jgi:hypothetical protein
VFALVTRIGCVMGFVEMLCVEGLAIGNAEAVPKVPKTIFLSKRFQAFQVERILEVALLDVVVVVAKRVGGGIK